MKCRFYNSSLINMTDSTAVIINGANSKQLFFGIQYSLVYEIYLVCVRNISFSLYAFLHCFLIKSTLCLNSVTMLHLWSLMAPIQQFHVATGHSFRYQIPYLWFHNLHLSVFILHSPYSVPTQIVFLYCISNSIFLLFNSHFLFININNFLFIIFIFDDLSPHFSTFFWDRTSANVWSQIWRLVQPLLFPLYLRSYVPHPWDVCSEIGRLPKGDVRFEIWHQSKLQSDLKKRRRPISKKVTKKGGKGTTIIRGTLVRPLWHTAGSVAKVPPLAARTKKLSMGCGGRFEAM